MINSNGSQWFITLDKAPWLDKKNTIFGKVTGNTIFNVLRLGEVEVDKDDRPLEPPRILSIEVLDSPFDDIVPRAPRMSPEAEAQQRAAAAAAADRATRGARGRPAANLLSFGGDDDDDGGGGSMRSSGGPDAKRGRLMLAAHEALGGIDATLVAPDREPDTTGIDAEPERLEVEVAGAGKRQAGDVAARGASGSQPLAPIGSRGGMQYSGDPDDDERGRRHRATGRIDHDRLSPTRDAVDGPKPSVDGHRSAREPQAGVLAAAQSKPATDAYTQLRAELRAARKAVNVRVGAVADAEDAAAAAQMVGTPLEQMRSKYKSRRQHGDRERETLSKLAAFTSQLRSAASSASTSAIPTSGSVSYSGQVLEDDGGDADDGASAIGIAASLATHSLKFKRHVDDAYRAGGDGLVTIDEGVGNAGGEVRRHSRKAT